jgi:hypothetical protein
MRDRLKASQAHHHVYFRYTPYLTDFTFEFIRRPIPPILSPSYWTFVELTLVTRLARNVFVYTPRGFRCPAVPMEDALLRLPYEAGSDASNAAARSSSPPRPPSPIPFLQPACITPPPCWRQCQARLAGDQGDASRLTSR